MLTAILVFAGTVLAASTESVLLSFAGGGVGANPYAGLVLDASGNLYGTTAGGGNSGLCSLGSGCGIVFELSPPATQGGVWTQTVLYNFQGQTAKDGSSPQAPLVFDKTGDLYGTTASGGAYGFGTAFKLTPPTTQGSPWTETVLYSFKAGSDGNLPGSGLIFSKAGALYGTTQYGGTGPCTAGGTTGCGTVFQLTPPAKGGAWTETILHSFTGTSPLGVADGSFTDAGLALDSTGSLYGTTYSGGVYGGGSVFKLTPPATKGSPWTEILLLSFPYGASGGSPYAGLVLNKTGSLFGTSSLGGTNNFGTIFELTPPATQGGAWTETILYNFTGLSDGGYPHSALLFDTKGKLYGTTTAINSTQMGLVLKLSPPAKKGGAWTETVLWSFTGGNDGDNPNSTLVMNTAGTFYGTTSYGGPSNKGTVFQVIP